MFTRTMRTAWVVMAFLGLIVVAFAVQTILVPAARSEVAVAMFARFPVRALLHMVAGMVMLVAGALNLDPGLRLRHRVLHRWMGRAYVAAVVIGGTAALLAAPWSYGGMVTHLGFGTLGVLSITTTLLGLAAIRKGDVRVHREWMIRSYALTLGAVMLRIYIPVSLVAGARFEEAYQVISWACWVPNLIVAELFFIGRRRTARALQTNDELRTEDPMQRPTAPVSNLLLGVLLALAAIAVPATASAQLAGHDVQLHVDTRWKECSFKLDPSLTQKAWHQFAGEAGVVTYFRPLKGAEPMGRGNMELSLMQWQTGIDDTDAAWNDTFVHPDTNHWLFEGEGLGFPGLTLRAGVSDRTDVGIYFTKNPGANYGFYGAQVQQSLVHTPDGKWSAAARASFVSMYGPSDLDFTVYGLDLIAGTRRALLGSHVVVSQYAGVSTSLSRAHEKSNVVDLNDENVLGAQGVVGAEVQVGMARLGIEYGVARVQSISFKVGVGRGRRGIS